MSDVSAGTYGQCSIDVVTCRHMDAGTYAHAHTYTRIHTCTRTCMPTCMHVCALKAFTKDVDSSPWISDETL